MAFGITYGAIKGTLTALKNRKVAKEIKEEQEAEDNQPEPEVKGGVT
jgi:hypothetical protein